VTFDLSFLGRLSVVSVANADRRTDSYKGIVLEQSGPGWIRGTSKDYTTDPENMILLHVSDAICPEQCRNFIYIARKMVQAFCWRHFQVLGCRILHCLVLSQTLPNYVVFFYLGILRVLFILKWQQPPSTWDGQRSQVPLYFTQLLWQTAGGGGRLGSCLWVYGVFEKSISWNINHNIQILVVSNPKVFVVKSTSSSCVICRLKCWRLNRVANGQTARQTLRQGQAMFDIKVKEVGGTGG